MSNNCSSFINYKSVVFEENKSKMELVNPTQRDLEKVCIDGCYIKSGTRCDWLLKDVQTNSEIYIELKGTDIAHAIEQIKTTALTINSGRSVKKTGIVVCVRCPVNSSQIQILTARLKKSVNINLIVKSSVYKENINKFI